MVIILHGENYTRSREIVIQLQKKVNAKNRTEFGVLDVTANELYESCTAFDIFSEPPFVVLNVAKAGRKNLKAYAEVLKKLPQKTNLIILTNKTLTKSNVFIKLASGKNAAATETKNQLKIKVVKSEINHKANIFRFVDTLFSKNRRQTYKELRNLLLEDTDPFYIFSMILYGLRNMAYAKFDSPKFAKMAPFSKSKAQNQAKKFSETATKRLFEEMYKLDKDVKTGKVTPNLLVPVAIERVLS